MDKAVFLYHIVDHSWTLYCSMGPALYVIDCQPGLRYLRERRLHGSPQASARGLRLSTWLCWMSSPDGLGPSPSFARSLRQMASALRLALPDLFA
jgi:hypothetical protein